jgi:predicted TIM-barrel fold metal-dependent hydrolase
MRDKELVGDAVAGEVIFPDAANGLAGAPFGSGLGASGASDAKLVLAGARAHNRWLADLCATSPERRAGILSAPILHDIDAAVAEIERAHDSGLWGGIMVPSQWAPAPSYNDARYDPIWARCQERNLVVHIHSGSQPLALSPGAGTMQINMSEQWFWAARPLWVMLLGGVFDRFPDMKFAVTEDGAWWVPDLIWKMDQKYDGGHNTRKFGDAFAQATEHRPSDYFGRNIFLGTSTPDPTEIERRHLIGVDAMMWGNDFPHSEGTWPHTREWINHNFHDVPEDETRKILGLNALRVYPFDTTKLAPIVERIGMTTADVHGTPEVASPRSSRRTSNFEGDRP